LFDGPKPLGLAGDGAISTAVTTPFVVRFEQIGWFGQAVSDRNWVTLIGEPF
jgi:hypothetical protein